MCVFRCLKHCRNIKTSFFDLLNIKFELTKYIWFSVSDQSESSIEQSRWKIRRALISAHSLSNCCYRDWEVVGRSFFWIPYWCCLIRSSVSFSLLFPLWLLKNTDWQKPPEVLTLRCQKPILLTCSESNLNIIHFICVKKSKKLNTQFINNKGKLRKL